MDPLLILQVLLSAILFGIGAFAFFIGFRRFLSDEVTSRLQEYVLGSPSDQSSNAFDLDYAAQELRGSFAKRVVVPRVRAIGKFLGRLTPRGAIENLERQLLLAGYPLGLGPREFYGIRVLFILLGGALGYILLSRGFTQLNILLGVISIVFCFLIPPLWLYTRRRARQEQIRRGLPDALDMLSVCSTAGLGFDQSLQRVSDHWSSPVGLEFGRAVTEMSMGLTREEALRNLADRVDVTELSTFTTLIIQSDQLGMSISDTLHAQAAQMRIFRRFQAEEEIRKIPTRMLFPIAFLIFPSILAVVLGPSLPVLRDFFQSF